MRALLRLALEAGLRPGYSDQTGTWREAPEESIAAALSALGVPAATDREAEGALAALAAEAAARPLPQWVVVEAGAASAHDLARDGDWWLGLEDGGELAGRSEGGRLALPGLPPGRHRLDVAGATTFVLSAPARLSGPARAWGVTLPLYGLPPREGGLASYADLADWAGVLGAAGAAFVGINPVHAGFPDDPMAFSPYSPSHRRRLSVMHIPAGEPPGMPPALVDYPVALAARRAALEARFAAGTDKAEFEAWRRAGGAALERFALHQALSEAYGPYWTAWPAPLCAPDTPEVAAFGRDRAGRVAFHAWLQWQAERALGAAQGAARAAGMRHGLYLDLAVGTHPAGAETWAERALFAPGVSLGAPPDAFSPGGQVWGVSPFSPRALAETGFAALAETLRAQLRFAGALRIDHILGFERAFWVPQEGGLPGLYVQMPRAALLAVARIEAARAGAVIVGEDLGNIPDGLQEDLRASGVLGCRVAIFERAWQTGGFKAAEEWDTEVLGSFSTHDLPTWKGWRNGRDIDWRARLGRSADPAAERHQRAEEVSAMDAAIGGAVGDAEAMHAYLGRTPCRLVAVQAEDILELEEQANLPGTIHEHPNWRRRLPLTAAELARDPRLARVAAIMKSCGRQGGEE